VLAAFHRKAANCDESSGLDWCNSLCELSPVAALGNCVGALVAYGAAEGG
jgi:hypothetical protein